MAKTNKDERPVGVQSLLSLSHVHVFSIQNGHLSVLGVGELSISVMDVHILLLSVPDLFQYPITADFPCLRASHLSFVFPGQRGFCFGPGQQGLSYGLILSNSTSTEDLDMFEALLSEYSQYRVEKTVSENAENKDTGKMVASFLKKGVKKGAAVASMGLQKSNAFLKAQISSKANVQISPQTKARIEKAKAMSKAATAGAKSMCSEVAAVALDAASTTEYGQKVVPSDGGKKEEIEKVIKPKSIWEELQDSALMLVTKGPGHVKDVPSSKTKKLGFNSFMQGACDTLVTISEIEVPEIEVNVEF